MRQLVSLQVSFEVEDEEIPPLAELLSEVETTLRTLDGIDEVAADIVAKTRKITLVAEVEGHDPDSGAASLEMIEVVKRIVPRLVDEPQVGAPWILNQEED